MSSNIIGPFPNKSVAPSERVEKAIGGLSDIEALVFMIHWKYLDNKKEKENTNKYNFQGHSAISKRWFDIYHEWLEEI